MSRRAERNRAGNGLVKLKLEWNLHLGGGGGDIGERQPTNVDSRCGTELQIQDPGVIGLWARNDRLRADDNKGNRKMATVTFK